MLTVCDRAAGEACPVWPGQPITAHWGLPDPAAVEGPAEMLRGAFRQTLVRIEDRIAHFLRVARSASHPDDWQIGLSEVDFPEESKAEPKTKDKSEDDDDKDEGSEEGVAKVWQ